MSREEIIQIITENIYPNGNNEITANVLNPVLDAMVNQINDITGNLDDLASTDTSNLVNAINSVITQFEGIDSNSVKLRSGIDNPNVTPPGEYNTADFYIQEDTEGNPLDLWQFNGIDWTKQNSQPDGFTQLGTLSKTGNTINVGIGYAWIINDILFSNTIPQNFPIENESTGQSRVDIIVTDGNQFALIQGDSSAGEGSAAQPQIPVGSLLLTSINIYEDNISEPIAGSDFVRKTGNIAETVTGVKTFENVINADGGLLARAPGGSTLAKFENSDLDSFVEIKNNNEFQTILTVKDYSGAETEIYPTHLNFKNSEASKNLSIGTNVNALILLPNANGTLALTSDLANKADLVDGKVPLSQINDALIGAVNYQGNYNASNNTPALPTAVGNKGKYYVVTVAGTQQGLTFTNGDWIISNGTIWEKVDSNNDVTSVAGKTGAVTLGTTDIGGLETALNLKANDADVLHKTGDETKTSGKLTINGQFEASKIKLSPFSGSTGGWIDMPTDFVSGIGDGGVGFNVWVAKTNDNAQFFSNAIAGDLVYRNTMGRLLFGTVADVNSQMVLSTSGLSTSQPISTQNATAPNHAAAFGQVQTEIATVSDLTVALVVPNLYKYYALTGLSAVASLPPIAGNVGKTLIVTNKTDATQSIFSNDSVANDIFSSTGAVNNYSFKGSVTLFNDGAHWVITN